ncbi:MAG: hypothetical protein JO130_05830, partial [Solirubrobacterales bacterium]|nr:hypothetical protein [Solirubrobacterales bacterium]
METRSLDEIEQQGGAVEQAGAAAEKVTSPAEAGPPPGVPPSEPAAPEGAAARSAAPRATMSREDVYVRPMRAGKPISNGPMARMATWLKYTLSSELQRR